MGKWALIVVALVTAALMTVRNDPYNTRLPWRFSDMHQVQKQLDRLPIKDQQRVISYMHRSNGDRLPAQFGDPDNPLTAETFKEAIKLEQAYQAKQAR
ncbi:MAG: hypothetical protein AB1717_08935 [Pseudomonadota bacterium]